MRGLVGIVALTLLAGFALVTDSAAQTPPPRSGEALPIKVALRRLTESQYRHTIADVFGPEIKINARFEPEQRVDMLLAIGSAQLSLTSSGFEQYFALASSISEQVLSEKQRTVSVPCKPADATRGDDACARLFLESYGERLFRRPLTQAEISARLRTASTGAKQSSDSGNVLSGSLSPLRTSSRSAPSPVSPRRAARAEPGGPRPSTPGRGL